ncbi:MAG TPA: transglycosylase SLT domain-containing protein [Blastocatellia bacterium]|nr:transglycosylase SLT domain-containing protein [Blastocatellia bacterium]
MKHRIFYALFLLTLGGNTVSAKAVTDRYDDTFRKYSKRFFSVAFDWRIFKAQGMAESNLNMNARSWVGAKGIMQLMPTTFQEIRSRNPEIKAINHPEWNIAAGIYYDRQLWTQWQTDAHMDDHNRFMLSSYNAGRGTLMRAQKVAQTRALDPTLWLSIRTIAPDVPAWRHQETLSYIERIEANLARMDEDGRVVP